MLIRPLCAQIRAALATALTTSTACIGLMTSSVFAEDETLSTPVAEADIEQIIILSTRSNFMNAQWIKRDADTVVDAVSAVDIRVLENRSVLDAIQRLPGISLERFAAPNDADRFSVEASNVVIRGMSQSRSEFNGRDSFTANAGRGLSYQDVPPELMGSIEIYKNQTADRIEGGIAGTVTLQTRKPFDTTERLLAFSSDLSRGDLAKTWSPSYSALFSDRMNSAVGEFGVLINIAKSTMHGASHGVQSDSFTQYYARMLTTPDNPGALGTRAEDFLGSDNNGMVWIPNGANVLTKQDTRERLGFTTSAQYQNPANNLLLTAEYIRSDARLSWHERAIKYQGGYYTPDTRETRPLAGTHMVFDNDGLFLAGTMTNGRDNFRVGTSGTNRVPKGALFSQFPQWGHKTQMDSRVNDASSLVEDLSFNLQWQASDRLKLSGDYQYIRAKSTGDDLSIHINTWAHIAYDLRGSLPSVTYIEPWNGARDAARARDGSDNPWDRFTDGVPNWPGFGGDPQGDQNYFQDPNSYYWRSAMDHYNRSNGDALAARFDADWQLDHPLWTSVKAGVRYAERQQAVRATSWNWGALAPEWQGGSSDWDLAEGETMGRGIGWLPDLPSQQDGYEWVDWSGFMRGGVVNIQGNQTIHASEDFIRSVMGTRPSRVLLQSPVSSNWEPYPTRTGLDHPFGLFRPDEINYTREVTDAAYLRVDFAGQANVAYSGNVGLRYVSMTRSALGVVQFPMLPPLLPSEPPVPEGIDLPLTPQWVDDYLHQQVTDGSFSDYASAANSVENRWVKNPYNFLSDQERAFSQPLVDAEGAYVAAEDRVNARTHYTLLLPSFNIKVDFSDTLVGRFALAKAAAFPDMGDVRNRVQFHPLSHDDIQVTERVVTTDTGRQIIMVDQATLQAKEGDLTWVAGGGNPFIKPMTSVQYDFSLEWYFSDYGQLSAAIFHKTLKDYFTQGVITRPFTHPITGSTQNTAVTTTRNGGKAKLDGVETTYHQFFSGWLEGFGVQATYTYIDAHSMPNNEKDVSDEQWFDSIYEDTGIRVNFDRLPLEGQSRHTANIMGIYENHTWSTRLAYNWRSRYLLTTRDVISKAPLWYDHHGELDAAFYYHINNHFTVGLQATNITNAQSRLLMILNDDLLSTGRSWFVSDRRVSLVLRGEL